MFKGQKVTLRPLDLSDVDHFMKQSMDIELNILGGWSGLRSIPNMRERFEQRIKDPAKDVITMTIEVDGAPIGDIDLHLIDWDERRGEIGIIIDRSCCGKGYGKDALLTFLQYLFLVRNIRKVTAESYDFNKASIALFRSAGFAQEGILRSQVFATGAYRDMYVFGMLRDEFLEKYPDRRFQIPQ